MQETQSSARAQKIKDHFSKHRELYIRSGLVIGTAVFSTALSHATRPMIVTAQGKNFASVGNNVTINYNDLRRRGTPQNVIRCVETGVIYPSQNAAATELGISAADLSKHLNHGLALLKGLHFERVGIVI